LRFSREAVADLMTQKLVIEGVTFSLLAPGRAQAVRAGEENPPPAEEGRLQGPQGARPGGQGPESAPVIGIGISGRAIAVDLDAESPHILGNAYAGGGKSVTLCCITCQTGVHPRLHTALPSLGARPGVTYCADIHDALIELGWEGQLWVRVAGELRHRRRPGRDRSRCAGAESCCRMFSSI